MGTTKTCTKCKQQFPATLGYFYKSKRGVNGLHPRCKNCINVYQKERCKIYRENNRDIINKRAREKFTEKNKHKQIETLILKYLEINGISKKCKNCNEFFPPNIDYFHKNKEIKSGLNAVCKSCVNIKRQAYINKNRQKIKDYNNNLYENDSIFRNKRKTYSKKIKQKHINEITDNYLLALINHKEKIIYNINDIPSEILETKRLLIKIKRELKCQNQKKQSVTQNN